MTNNAQQPLQSVHTDSFTQILNQLGLSVAITTYQQHRLIIARSDGQVTNTHFRVFEKPMGLAFQPGRLALGVDRKIITLCDVPAVAAQLDNNKKHDACYLPRQSHTTGDIDIHEMAWVNNELWFINTRFSCLCTLDSRYSFVPRWKPPFITAYDMRDRCHLNGLAIKDNQPRYVSALGTTDTPGGWRAKKASGGILMDISNNQIMLEGLSMPHSPRWYRNRLWFLESGKGTLCYEQDGKCITVAELPGFTRGLSFVGDLAFIGLSQVRETAVFAGLPLTKTQPVRHSGVWVVNLLNGSIVAFLRFEQGVQEIFAVEALPHRYPEVFDENKQLESGSYVLPDEALKTALQPDKQWSSAESLFEQGNQAYNQGDGNSAIKLYQQCLELQADYLPARFNLAIAVEKSQPQQAMSLLKEVVDAEAGHAEAHNRLGYLYGKQEKHEQAIEHLQLALKIRPDYDEAKKNLTQSLTTLAKDT